MTVPEDTDQRTRRAAPLQHSRMSVSGGDGRSTVERHSDGATSRGRGPDHDGVGDLDAEGIGQQPATEHDVIETQGWSGRVAPEADHLILRPATIADAQILLQWRNDPQTRASSYDQSAVKWDSHMYWLGTVLVDPARELVIAEF